ncbi:MULTISPECIES: enoyl-CoA hydratase/isomerase family protein [unclassified Streptomyces]|uniref:enoyl-CoA hydratase/isomerase family protein n=1 Tax=unclassified Streptomyces TaxID=2593676 RepID=UPI002E2DCAC8|nr:enoyl-CoA hydratase/isomerase family protein [Streptomyces sp. NBC_00223]
MDTTAEPVITRVRAGTAVIELDRPRALNALDLTMVRLMTRALEEWREDDAVRAVVVRSTSPKAFCAGGDIRAVREAGMRGDDTAVRAYFSAEYGLDGLIARYPKPYIALIDGYAMGGGLGISVHGSARVVTERASLAMPETSIGFFPDIGASWFLPRLPGAVGWYLGLTGVRIQAADAVDCGLATHYVPAAELPALEAALTGEGPLADRGADPAEALDRFATPAPPSDLAGHREAIERCFTAPDLAGVRARLAAEEADREWARDTLAALDRGSPASLAITFDLLRDGLAADSVEECLARELELASRVARSPDFHEGVRAVLVDKDRRPAWSSAG